MEGISDAIEWLLEPNNPGIRYRTLAEILGRGFHDPDVRSTYEKVWESAPVRKILGKLGPDGRWPTQPYGVHTSLRYLSSLAEHGIGRDSRIEAGVDQALEFLREKEASAGVDRYDGCSEALLLRALVMLGYGGNSSVHEMLCSYSAGQLFDGGFICERLLNERANRKSCYRAAVAGLLLYAACTQQGMMLPGRDQLIEFFVKRDVYLTSDKKRLVVDLRPGWRYVDNFFPAESMRVGLPLIVHALFVLGAANHPGVEPACRTLADKEDPIGRLSLEGTLTKQPVSFGAVGKPNKWMTFYAVAGKVHGSKVSFQNTGCSDSIGK